MINISFDSKKYQLTNNTKLKIFLKDNNISDKNIFLAIGNKKNNIINDDFILKNDYSIVSFNKENAQLFNIYFQDIGYHIFVDFLLYKYKNKIKFVRKTLNNDNFFIDFILSGENLDSNFKNLLLNYSRKIIKKNTILRNDKGMVVISNNNSIKCTESHFTKIPDKTVIDMLNCYGIHDPKQQIYRLEGTCFGNKELLDLFLNKLEIQKSTDHRFINKKIKYFLNDDRIGSGLPIWTASGTQACTLVEKFIDDIQINKYFYKKVSTSPIGSEYLYKTSGHLEHYKDTMFPAIKTEHGNFYLRPMTCPHHCILFSDNQVSYRDLPYKLYETSPLFRYEKSGGLKGLERTRWMRLADCHTFCDEEHLPVIFDEIFEQFKVIFKEFNIKLANYRLSIPDENLDKFQKNNKIIWVKAIKFLKESLKKNKIDYQLGKGDAAFYAPKIDVQIYTSQKTEITLATIQLDYILPQKFNLSFINKDGNSQPPILIHHSLIGTYERFISILIEQNNGAMPFKFAPLQFIIIPVSNKNLIASTKINTELLSLNFRSKIDNSEERLSYKIRKYETEKPSFIIIIGDKEQNEDLISFRKINSNKNETLPKAKFMAYIKKI